MFKRISILTAVFVLMFAIAGCSNTSSNTTATKTTTVGGQTSTVVEQQKELPVGEGPLFHNDGWPAGHPKLEGVPVPNFSVQPVSVVDSNVVEVVYENVPQNEVTDWINAVKQAGFKQDTEKRSTTEYIFKGTLPSQNNGQYGGNMTYLHVDYTSDGTLTVKSSY